VKATVAAGMAASPTLAADAALDRWRHKGRRVLALGNGEIGLPVLPVLRERLARAAGRAAYGPVAGDPRLRESAAGYWTRRGLPTDPEFVVCGPGSKPLLFALLLAIGGDVVIPVPSWVSYGAQTVLAGGQPIRVRTSAAAGGVPEADALRAAVHRARVAGRDPRSVVVTLPDNPTGTIAPADAVQRLVLAARELDLVIISDEIYGDLVFDPADRTVSPARMAPERTVVTTGLAKSLALGGWRTGVARLPASESGSALRDRLVTVASHIWSSASVPVQAAAAYAFDEPPDVTARIAASLRLHETVVRAVGARLAAAGAELSPIRATCYLYPDFAPLCERLVRGHGIHRGSDLASLLARRYGVGVLPGSAFGEEECSLRIRIATSRLYGETEAETTAALQAPDPLALPWIDASLARLDEVLDDLLTVSSAARL